MPPLAAGKNISFIIFYWQLYRYVAPGLAQEEGRRIVELLLRFDPIRLRSEFQPLYSHRMHYQASQASGLSSLRAVGL